MNIEFSKIAANVIPTLSNLTKCAVASTTLSVALMVPANASVIATLTEVGDDVVAEFSGSINLTGLTFDETATTFGVAGLLPSSGSMFFTPGFGFAEMDVYSTLIGPNFGPGPIVQTTETSGDFFGFFADTGNLVLPLNYVSEEHISGSFILKMETLAGLGATEGVYTYNLPNDFVSMTVGNPSIVPLPATLPLLLFGLASIALAGRRRQKVC